MRRPSRSDCQLEFPSLGQEQAMTVVPGPLSPEAAVIAEKIPRIAPLLRMIESCGFEVVGLEAAPVTAKPVHAVNHSPGSRAFHKLLERRGYQVALSDPPEPSYGKAVSV